LKALRDYKSGARKNPIMAGQVSGLSPQDLADLAAYFSSQKGSLHVVR
jgi:cytochrome c553